jgi:hypothetical protein
MTISDLLNLRSDTDSERDALKKIKLRGDDVWLLQTLAGLRIESELHPSSKQKLQDEINNLLQEVKVEHQFLPETIAAANLLAGKHLEAEDTSLAARLLASRFVKSQSMADPELHGAIALFK